MEINRESRLQKISDLIDYQFKDKQLILAAITTRAYSNQHPECPNNQALEFLGDAILSFISAELFYEKWSQLKVKEFILEFLDFSSLLANENKLIEAVTRKNPKDMLIHKIQKLKKYTPNMKYPLIEDRFNPDDNTHHFVLGIQIDGILLPGITGEGTNKAEAEYQAAENAYRFLDKISWDLSIVS